MKVIICGAGQVGWQIARHLASEKNDVTIVDSDQDLVVKATDTLDVKGVSGFASYPNVLSNAGAEDADMIIAATHSDEVNMVTCQVHILYSIYLEKLQDCVVNPIWMLFMQTYTDGTIFHRCSYKS